MPSLGCVGSRYPPPSPTENSRPKRHRSHDHKWRPTRRNRFRFLHRRSRTRQQSGEKNQISNPLAEDPATTRANRDGLRTLALAVNRRTGLPEVERRWIINAEETGVGTADGDGGRRDTGRRVGGWGPWRRFRLTGVVGRRAGRASRRSRVRDDHRFFGRRQLQHPAGLLGAGVVPHITISLALKDTVSFLPEAARFLLLGDESDGRKQRGNNAESLRAETTRNKAGVCGRKQRGTKP